MTNGYLGIDESNHGREPEIFVAVHSSHKLDIEFHHSLGKHRKHSRINSVIGGIDFRSIVVLSQYKRNFSDSDMKIIVFSEFIKSFGQLEKVVIDGEVDDEILAGVEKAIYPIVVPQLISEPKADVSYPIVNIADQIANHLFRNYVKNRSVGKKFEKHMLLPRLNDYRFLTNRPS